MKSAFSVKNPTSIPFGNPGTFRVEALKGHVCCSVVSIMKFWYFCRFDPVVGLCVNGLMPVVPGALPFCRGHPGTIAGSHDKIFKISFSLALQHFIHKVTR